MIRNVKMKVGDYMRAKSDRDSITTASFLHGWAAALADLNRIHDEPTAVANTMRGGGVSLADLKRAGVEAYDLDEIRKCMPKRRRDR